MFSQSEIVVTVEQLFSNLICQQSKVHVLIAVILYPNLLIETLVGEMQEMFTKGSYALFTHIHIRIPSPIVPHDRRIILIRVTINGVKLAIMGGEFWLSHR
jgi:hypothetical protein